MPHDSKGREISKGDYLKVDTYAGKRVAEVASVIPGANSCNVSASYMVPGTVIQTSFNAQDCELVMKSDGSDPA